MEHAPQKHTLNQQNIQQFIEHLEQLIGHDQNQKDMYVKMTTEQISENIKKFQDAPHAFFEQNSLSKGTSGNNQHFSLTSNVQQLSQFSPGVYLLFKMLKTIIILLVPISLVSFVQLTLLLNSPYYQNLDEQNRNIRVQILRITLASLKHSHYQIYWLLDVVQILVIVAFLVWWSEKIRTFAADANEKQPLPSYLTAILQSIGPNYNENMLKQYLDKEGVKVEQIYTGRNYGRFLRHYTKLTESAIKVRILKDIFDREQQQVQKHQKGELLIKEFLKLKRQYCKIKTQKFNQKKYKPKKVFIVFRSYQDRQKLLQKQQTFFSKLKKCFSKSQQQYQFQFKPCQVEPEAIAWQNLGISPLNYWLRALAVFLILCLVTCLGIILIFMLQVLETASVGDAYYFSQQKQQNNIQKTEQSHIVLQSSSLSYSKSDIHVSTQKLAFLIILTPIVVFVCKKMLMGLLSHFVHFRKYTSQISRIKSQTLKLTFFYFTVIAVLHLVLYLKANYSQKSISIFQLLQPIIVNVFKITKYSPVSIHFYSDFSLDWYKQSSIFIIIIASTSFNITNLFKLLLSFISFKIQKIKAQKSQTLYELHHNLKGIDLHIQNISASMITIILFMFIYMCPFPLIPVLALINLFVLFWVSKFVLVKFGTKPLRMGHSLIRICTNILFIGVILHCVITPIFMGASGIGVNRSHSFYNHSNEGQEEKTLQICERYQKFGPVYFTIAAFCAIYVLFRKPTNVYLISKIKKWLKSKSKNEQDKNMIQDAVEKESGFFGVYPSYSMHKNKKYKQVVKNMHLLNHKQSSRNSCSSPFVMPPLSQKTIAANSNEGEQIFQKILEINNEYVDKQKNRQLYEEMREIAQIGGFLDRDYKIGRNDQLSAQRSINDKDYLQSDNPQSE